MRNKSKKGGIKMNAQELVSQARTDDENLKIFYPTIHDQKQADNNLSKCLRALKE